MFGFKSLMAKILFDEVFSAVLNSEIGIIMKKSYKQLFFSLLAGCYMTPLHGKQSSSIQNPSLNCYGVISIHKENAKH